MNDIRLSKLDELMDEYVYGLMKDRRADRIRRKIENDPEWQLAYEEAVGRKRMLTGFARTDNPKTPVAAFTAARAIEAAEGVYSARLRRRRRLRWSSGIAAAAAMLLIGWMWISYAAVTPPTHTVRLIGQDELISGSKASLCAIVTDFHNRPSPNVPVKLVLTGSDGGEEIQLAVWRTGADGVAAGQIDLPEWEGDCKLVARAGDNQFQLIGAPIELKRATRVYLSTDKPIYQPGQTIHMRTLVLRTGSLKPDAGKAVELSVTDPAGNVIFRQSRKLSDYGIAWADLSLDSLIAPGRYRITAATGADESTQTVEISHYKLPAFSMKIETDKPYYRPGETISGKIRLKYNFGEPVKGAKIKLSLTDRMIELQVALNQQTLTASDEGVVGFEIPLPKTVLGDGMAHNNTQMLLIAKVTDPVGQENTGYHNIPVAAEDIRIAAIAENGLLPKGAAGRLYVVTSYPDGKPAKCIVDIAEIGRSIRTDETGAAVLEAANLPIVLRISARDDQGRTGRTVIKPPVASDDSLVLRTDKPMYSGGETIALQVIGGKAPLLFIDVVKDRQTVLTRTIKLENGRGTAAIDLPPDLSGTLRLHAYKLDSESQWIGRDAVVIVKQANGLKVDVSSDKEVHRPGQDAKISFRVTDSAGKPQVAAISLAGVDEAVFSLQQSAPGLEGLLNGLDEELLIPAIEVHGLSAAMMHKSTRYAEAVMSAAALEAARQDAENSNQWTTGTNDRLHSLDVSNKDMAMSVYNDARNGAEGRARTVSFWGVIGIAAALAFFGVSFVPVSTGIDALSRSRWTTLAVVLIFVSVLGTLLVRGSLQTLGSGEEQPMWARASRDSFQTSGGSDGSGLFGSGEGLESPADTPGLADAGSANHIDFPADTGLKIAKPVRTRTYFPETMLWRPQVITDPQGRADLTVPLADSITTWRLSGSAVSKSGLLGRVSGSVRVFQPFFADVNSPTDLTRGDEVSVPLVLYNYADKQLSVSLECKGSDGLTVVGAAAAGNVSIDPGQVSRVMVRVKADQIGSGRLQVLARSADFADSIRREIRIAPPGRPAWAVVNAELTDGPQVIDVPIPEDAVPGSVAMRLKVYPSTFSELLDGLDGIFRQPSGCFEQTSSTTYPNVMALAYMRTNKLDNPEIEAKAARYIQMGYQRLLTFEIKGGGFDWFGRGPANVVLTAYGLMEFADMARVYEVDPKLLERTANWLASQQNESGGWKFGQGCFHEPFTGGDNSELAITAYVTWAIAGYKPDHRAAVKGAAYIREHVGEISGPYTLALCANALQAAGDSTAGELIRRLASSVKRIDKDKAFVPVGGGSKDVRATSLMILAMKDDKRYAPTVRDSLRWLASKRDSAGAWGATQSTIMALKAMTEGASGGSRKRDSDARVVIGSTVLNIPAAASDTVRTAVITSPAEAGRTMRLDVTAAGAAGLPCQVVVHYHTQRPVARAEAPVQIKVDYDRSDLRVGQTATVRAIITNNSPAAANMLLADVGTPPGFSVDSAGLEKLRAAGKIDRYTVTSRGVIFYITRLAAGAGLTLEYKMTAKLPLNAKAAPTTIYPYYQPQQLSAAQPAAFTVTAAE